MKKSGWEHFPHDADVGIRGYGETLAEAFAQAALAMTAVITDPKKVVAEQSVRITCSAPDLDTLLVDWINSLVLMMATRKLIFSHFDVDVDDGELIAVAHGEPVDVAKHEPATEVKGATFTALSVSRDRSGLWQASCILDV